VSSRVPSRRVSQTRSGLKERGKTLLFLSDFESIVSYCGTRDRSEADY
jgi:hypothetical protein